MKEPELTHEAKHAIRNYMLKLVAIPVGILTIFVGLLGFFIQDIAVKEANNVAYREAATYIRELSNSTFQAAHQTKLKTEETKKFLDLALKEIRQVKGNLSKLEKEAQTIFESLKTAKSFQDSENIVSAVTGSLVKRKDFIGNIINRANVVSKDNAVKIKNNKNAINKLSQDLSELNTSIAKLNKKIEVGKKSSLKQSAASTTAFSDSTSAFDQLLDYPDPSLLTSQSDLTAALDPADLTGTLYPADLTAALDPVDLTGTLYPADPTAALGQPDLTAGLGLAELPGNITNDYLYLSKGEAYSHDSGLELILMDINEDNTANINIKTDSTPWQFIKNAEVGLSCTYGDHQYVNKMTITDIEADKVSIEVTSKFDLNAALSQLSYNGMVCE